MKSLIEKQILEWKEELDKQTKTRDHAQKVLDEANANIKALSGGIQFGELVLKKNESLNQRSDKEGLNPESEVKPSKK